MIRGLGVETTSQPLEAHSQSKMMVYTLQESHCTINLPTHTHIHTCTHTFTQSYVKKSHSCLCFAANALAHSIYTYTPWLNGYDTAPIECTEAHLSRYACATSYHTNELSTVAHAQQTTRSMWHLRSQLRGQCHHSWPSIGRCRSPLPAKWKRKHLLPSTSSTAVMKVELR